MSSLVYHNLNCKSINNTKEPKKNTIQHKKITKDMVVNRNKAELIKLPSKKDKKVKEEIA